MCVVLGSVYFCFSYLVVFLLFCLNKGRRNKFFLLLRFYGYLIRDRFFGVFGKISSGFGYDILVWEGNRGWNYFFGWS